MPADSLQRHLPPSAQPPASTTLLEPSGGPFIKEAHTSLHIGPNLDFYHVGPLLVSDGLNDSIYPIKYRRQRWYAWNGIGLQQRGAEPVEGGGQLLLLLFTFVFLFNLIYFDYAAFFA